MAFTVSPGVVTKEIDLTAIVPEVGATAGATAGAFRWGPIEDIIVVSSEDDLVKRFNKPDSLTYNYFFTAANFLAYGNNLSVVRTANSLARNASTSGTQVLIKNNDKYYNTYDPNLGGTAINTAGDWAAKYAGTLGNSLKVSLCGADKPSATLTGTVTVAGSTTPDITGDGTAFLSELAVNDVIKVDIEHYMITAITNDALATSVINKAAGAAQSAGSTATRLKSSGFEEPATTLFGTVTIAAGSTALGGSAAAKFDIQLNAGDTVTIGSQEVTISSVTTNTAAVLKTAITNAATTSAYSRKWEYHGSVDTAPTTTTFGTRKGTPEDEVHIVIVDEDGDWTGTKGEVLESYPNLSVASDAKADDGTDLFYKEAINRKSSYIWWMKHNALGDAVAAINTLAWGAAADSSVAPKFQSAGIVITSSFVGGIDGNTMSNGDLMIGFDKFKSAQEADISLIPTGNASSTVTTHVINNIAEKRKDCVVFCSPELTDVVDNAGSEAADVVEFRNTLPGTTYAMLDSGYKYQYDKYNDKFRYIPLNADMAGLTVRATAERDFFFSPAGFDRGQVKNVTKLPYNPDKTARDILYKSAINPVVTFPGQGTVLFGDKTLAAKPSAFDRINVRRLFIVLEKAISRFAQAQLFEFNDDFTRARFVAAVEPFLRDVQGRGGITDFAVVCDDTNNTADIVDRNQFVGSIFVKPSRPINFILLNFVAVRSGVEFSEITNAV